jgi:hypothetical protein
MDEEQWLCGTDPAALLAFVQGSGRASERKLRLFATACCRRIWHLLTDERSRKGVEVIEQYADGLAAQEQLLDAYDAAEAAAEEAYGVAWDAAEASALGPDSVHGAWEASMEASAAARAVVSATAPASESIEEVTRKAQHALAHVASPIAFSEDCHPDFDRRRAAESEEQANQLLVLRCIFGNPFRAPPIIDLAWLTDIVKHLAEDIYEDRLMPSGELDGVRLAVLADALEEAGCPPDHELLAHFRGPGPHVRGCHGLDLLTDRE